RPGMRPGPGIGSPRCCQRGSGCSARSTANSINLNQHIRPDADPKKLGLLRAGTVLPIDERVISHWNHDPYKLDQGGDGYGEHDGTSYLLPFWMGRYHRLI
ncbi:hypothetical protein AB0K48_60125, partial [Nonomuraea sp. NPDC055795]